MNDVKGRHFEGAIILWAVHWYCKYGVSYRELEGMLEERGVVVDHTTIYRWTQRYAPEIEKRLRWSWRRPRSTSWRADETDVKVRGRWAYLYSAVDYWAVDHTRNCQGFCAGVMRMDREGSCHGHRQGPAGSALGGARPVRAVRP